MTKPARRSIWPLVALIVLFFGPMLASVVMYFSADGWRPVGSTAHGELLEDPPVLRVHAWTGPAGGQAPEGKWYLVQIGSGHCPTACQEALVESRQVRRTLGRDMGRVQRVLWLIERDAERLDLDAIAAAHPELLVLEPDETDRGAILAALEGAEPGERFVVDPLGNLILRFESGIGMREMQDDLKKLLRASQIG